MDLIEDITAIVHETLNEYLKIIDEFSNVINSLKPDVTRDEFGSILLMVYPLVAHDILPGSAYLSMSKSLTSMCIVCRSLFEIVIQLSWILSLPDEKKSEAISLFLSFKGFGENSRGHTKYEWYDLMSSKDQFSYRAIAIKLGIDSEDLKFYSMSGNDSEKIVTKKMSIYDFLSKTVHFNPMILKENVKLYMGKHVIFSSNYYLQCIPACMTLVNCTAVFYDIFIGHFYKDQHLNLSNKIMHLQKEFQNVILQTNLKLACVFDNYLQLETER